MQIVRDSAIRIKKEDFDLNTLPCFDLFNEKSRFSKWEPSSVSFCKFKNNEYIIPRHYPIGNLYSNASILEKKWREAKPINSFSLNIEPYNYQNEALDAWFKHGDDGVIVAPCGSGKTTMGLEAVRRIRKKTMIICPTKQLVDQWVERFQDQAGITPTVFRKKDMRVGDITISTVQSLYNLEETPEEFKDFGLLIVDEVHSTGGAIKWAQAAEHFNCIRLGVTATPDRQDPLNDLLDYTFGPVVCRISHQRLVESGNVITPDVFIIKVPYTDYMVYEVAPTTIMDEYHMPVNDVHTKNKMAENKARNDVVFQSILNAYNAGRKTLVMTSRHSQIDALSKMLGQKNIKHGVVKGKQKKEDFDKNMDNPVILGVSQIVKMGLDDPALDTLIFAMPYSKKTVVEQAIGRPARVLKKGTKKQPLIIDIVDNGNRKFVRMFNNRMQIYQSLGCKIRNR